MNVFLTASMSRKIFIWYFIDYILKSNRVPPTVNLALHGVRRDVAATISGNMLSMIEKQGREKYATNGDNNNLVTYLASSAMEMTSMCAIVFAMSFVTEEMLEVAHTGQLSTADLLREVFAGLTIYSNQVDALSDKSLLGLGRKVECLQSTDYIPNLFSDTLTSEDGNTNNSQVGFVKAHLVASLHIRNVRDHIGKLIQSVRTASDYVPEATAGHVHSYPPHWTDSDYHLENMMAPSETTYQFSQPRLEELAKLTTLANSVSLGLMVVGVQRQYPNQLGHTFSVATGGENLSVMDDTVNDLTKACIQQAHSMHAYRGIGLSLIHTLIAESHKAYIQARTVDMPDKLVECQDASEDLGRISGMYLTQKTNHAKATAAKKHSEAVLQFLEHDVDVFFFAWHAGTAVSDTPVDSETFINSDGFVDRIGAHFTRVFEGIMGVNGYEYSDEKVSTKFLNTMVRPTSESMSGPWEEALKWGGNMLPLEYSLDQFINADLQTSDQEQYPTDLFVHPVVQIFRQHYQKLEATIQGAVTGTTYPVTPSKQEFYVLKFLIDEIVEHKENGDFWKQGSNWYAVIERIHAKILVLIDEKAQNITTTTSKLNQITHTHAVASDEASHQANLANNTYGPTLSAVLTGENVSSLQYTTPDVNTIVQQIQKDGKNNLLVCPEYDLLQAVFNGVVYQDAEHAEQVEQALDFRTYCKHTTSPENLQKLTSVCQHLLSPRHTVLDDVVSLSESAVRILIRQNWGVTAVPFLAVDLELPTVGTKITDSVFTLNDAPAEHIVALHLVARLIEDGWEIPEDINSNRIETAEGKVLYTLLTPEERKLAPFLYLHGAIFVKVPDYPPGTLLYTWPSDVTPPQYTTEGFTYTKDQILFLRQAYDLHRRVDPTLYFAGPQSTQDNVFSFGVPRERPEGADMECLPGVVPDRSYKISSSVAQIDWSQTREMEAVVIPIRWKQAIQRNKFRLLVEQDDDWYTENMSSSLTESKYESPTTFEVDNKSYRIVVPNMEMYHFKPGHPWWFLHTAPKTLLFMTRTEVEAFQSGSESGSGLEYHLPLKFFEYFNTVHKGSFTLNGANDTTFEIQLEVDSEFSNAFFKAILTVDMCDYLKKNAFVVFDNSRGVDLDYDTLGEVDGTTKIKITREFAGTPITEMVRALHIEDVLLVVVTRDDTALLDFMVKHQPEHLVYIPTLDADSEPLYHGSIQQMIRGGLLEYITRQYIVFTLSVLQARVTARLAAYKGDFQIMVVNRSCSEVLRTLLTDVVPKVRSNLLMLTHDFVDRVSQEERAADLMREKLNKKNVTANTRLVLATTMVKEATQYQNSQTVPLIEADTLKDVVKSAVRARAKFDQEQFNTVFEAQYRC